MNRPQLARQQSKISREERERLAGQRGRVVWLTGLSGAGKSTLAYALELRLHERGWRSFVLDGDNIRHGLCADLDFSSAGRHENLRRVAEVARLFAESGSICIAAFISPMRADRDMVRRIIEPEHYLEVHVDCPLPICEARDVKGLYRRARSGELADFTGISSPYEPPVRADLVLATDELSVEDCLEQLLEHLGLPGRPA